MSEAEREAEGGEGPASAHPSPKSVRARRRRSIKEDAVNLPNLLTLARILVIPVVLFFLGRGGPRDCFYAALVYAAAAITDSGYAYALAKRGVIRAAGRAAVGWGRRGGRVNSVAPGLIDTPMGRQEFEQQPIMRQMLERTPVGRLGRPEEVAVVVTHLLSDDFSFVSGIDVLVDGGMVQGMAAPDDA